MSILPLSGDDADRMLAGLDGEARWASMHVVRPDGSVLSGGAALAWLLRVRRVPGAPAVADRLYAVVAGHRAFLSRLVPDVPPVVRPARRH